MHKLSLHHLTMLDAHPLELVDAAAAGGFEYCGMRIVAPMATDTIVDVAHNAQLIREICARLASTGVQLLDIEAIWLQPTTDIQALLPALEAGRRMGARHVLSVGFDTDKSRLFENFCRLCEAAAQLDLTVGLEPITYCTIGTPSDALALIERSAQPNARYLIDVLQFFRSGAAARDVDEIPKALIEYVQICDAPAQAPETIDERRVEARTSRRLPGDGELPVMELLSRLDTGLTFAVEAPSEALRGMPFNEQARLIGDRVREFLHEL